MLTHLNKKTLPRGNKFYKKLTVSEVVSPGSNKSLNVKLHYFKIGEIIKLNSSVQLNYFRYFLQQIELHKSEIVLYWTAIELYWSEIELYIVLRSDYIGFSSKLALETRIYFFFFGSWLSWCIFLLDNKLHFLMVHWK